MFPFPPAPVTGIDWSKKKSSHVYEVHGHIESTYSKLTRTWSALKFVSDPYIRIHGMAPALNYGQHILEGLKAFRLAGDPGGIALFRPDRNAVRFQHSAEVLSMPPVPKEMFVQACRAAVALNADYVPPHDSNWALYIRPQLYGTSAHLALSAPEEYKFCVFVTPTGAHVGTAPIQGLILDDFDRAAPKGTGNAKVGGNYAPVMRWSDKANLEGFQITLHLDSARHEEVDEFSTCAFLGVYSNVSDEDDVTLVVPDSPCVIDSVTSDSAQRIAHSFGWKVEKRPILYSELPLLNEVIGAGTAVALVPIGSLTRRGPNRLSKTPRVRYSNGYEIIEYLSSNQSIGGPVYLKLLAQLKAIQLGKVKDEFGWRFKVQADDQKLDHASA